MTQPKKNLIFGYIREIQVSLPVNNPYYNITDDLKHLCASFIYWYHNKHPPMDCDLNSLRFIHDSILKQQSKLEHFDLCVDQFKRIMFARFKHLENRGFLAPAFLEKIRSDPQELLQFVRENRAVVRDQLNRRLNPELRPTIYILKKQGILPQDAYIYGNMAELEASDDNKSGSLLLLGALESNLNINQDEDNDDDVDDDELEMETSWNWGNNHNDNDMNITRKYDIEKPRKWSLNITNRLKRELLVFGYCRIYYLSSIPSDILILCLVMFGFDDFNWKITIKQLQELKDDRNKKMFKSPIFFYNNFGFQLIFCSDTSWTGFGTTDNAELEKVYSWYIKFIDLYNDKENHINDMVIFYTVYCKEIDTEYRNQIHLKKLTSDKEISSVYQDIDISKICEIDKVDKCLTLYGNLEVISMQIIDTINDKLKIYNQECKMYDRYKYKWNLGKLSNIIPSYNNRENKYNHYFSSKFENIWYLKLGHIAKERDLFSPQTSLQLNLICLPYNISTIYIEWNCKIQSDGIIKEWKSQFDTLSLKKNSWGFGTSLSNECSMNLKSFFDPLKYISIDIEIVILQIKDINYFSNETNIILRNNLSLYGIMNIDNNNNNNNEDKEEEDAIHCNNILLQEEIEYVTQSNNIWNNSKDLLLNHFDDEEAEQNMFKMNYLIKHLRNEYNDKIYKLEQRINELSLNNNDIKYKYQVNTECAKKVDEWLRKIVKLPQYFNIFVQNGFDSLDIIKEINDKNDLKYIGITIKAHQIKLINQINKL